MAIPLVKWWANRFCGWCLPNISKRKPPISPSAHFSVGVCWVASSFIGVDGTNTTLNSGRIQINLKPLDQRMLDQLENAPTVQQEAARKAGQKRRVRGMNDK